MSVAKILAWTIDILMGCSKENKPRNTDGGWLWVMALSMAIIAATVLQIENIRNPKSHDNNFIYFHFGNVTKPITCNPF